MTSVSPPTLITAMKSTILLFIIVISATFAHAGGTIVEDGGATIRGEAPAIQDLIDSIKPMKMSEIPGMNLLVEKFQTFNITQNDRIRYLNVILPSFTHFYYRMDENFVQGRGHDLILRYAAMTHQRISDVTLIRLEDDLIQRTLLLPNFFKVGEIGSAATILSHFSDTAEINETRIGDVQGVVKNYFDNPEDSENYFCFYFYLFTKDDFSNLFRASLEKDFKDHPEIFRDEEKKQIYLAKIIEPSFLKCAFTHDRSSDYKPCFSMLNLKSSSLVSRTMSFILINSDALSTYYFSQIAPEKLNSKFFEGLYFTPIEGFEFEYDFVSETEGVNVGAISIKADEF